MGSTFFGIQLAIRSPRGDPWRERLVALVRGNQGDQDLVEKRALHTRLAELLAEASSRWTLGTWDLVAGAGAAPAFDSWVSGLEACVDEPRRGEDADGDHAVVSVVFLVEAGSASDRTLGERCDLPESAWLERRTYERLLAAPRMLEFRSVVADGVYVVPGDPDCGVPLAELRGEGWEYLRPIG